MPWAVVSTHAQVAQALSGLLKLVQNRSVQPFPKLLSVAVTCGQGSKQILQTTGLGNRRSRCSAHRGCHNIVDEDAYQSLVNPHVHGKGSGKGRKVGHCFVPR